MKNRLSVVDDMAHASLLIDPGGEPEGDKVRVDPDAAQRISRALSLAAGKGDPLDIEAKRPVKSSSKERPTVRIAYRARVVDVSYSPDTRRHTTHTIEIEAPAGTGRKTLLRVTFGYERDRDPSRQWIGVQYNSTTLLTGQNALAADRVGHTVRRDRRFKAGWAFVVLMSVCRAADPSFRAPAGLLKAAFRGEAIVQNRQFALYMPVEASTKELTLAVLYAAFAATRIGKVDDHLQLVDLGRVLGIKADKYERTDVAGRCHLQTVMLRSRSGTHELASVALYDKSALDQGEIAFDLTGFLRADITLKPRGLESLLSEAISLATSNGEELELTRNAKGAVVRSEGNLAKAIAIVEERFRASIGGKQLRGMHAWLIERILFERFHLSEIFQHSEERWAAVEDWIDKWSRKSKAYEGAFNTWKSSRTSHRSLRALLRQACLSNDTVGRRLNELRDLGYSGDIPPTYWREWRAHTLTWGATDEELNRFEQRIAAGKPIDKLVKRWRTRMQPGLQALAYALSNFEAAAGLPNAPIAGVLEPPTSNPGKAGGRR